MDVSLASHVFSLSYRNNALKFLIIERTLLIPSRPPWMWHRVDYNGVPASTISIGASVFHFYLKQYAMNFPLFAFIIMPNLVWEALGFNIE